MTIVVNMLKINKILLTAAIFCFALAPSEGQTFEWSRSAMDGSRTGVTSSTSTDVEESMGKVHGRKYTAPNGRVFRRGATVRVAKLMIDDQEKMAPVKTVIGRSAKEMVKKYPESELTNWTADTFMALAEEKFGEKADASIVNYGGIRVNMPKGNILLDDIMSMFPFNNTVCLVTMKGRDLKVILDQMASSGFQCVGGMRITAQNGKIVSAEVGGEPLDENKDYKVATLSFLLNGGDGYHIARNAESVLSTKEYIKDLMIPYIKRLNAEGKMVDSSLDGRVRILDKNGDPMPVVTL